jgi:hypothetical protein
VTDHDDATVDDWDGDGELTLPPPADPVGDARRELAEQFVAQARATGLSLVCPEGLLADITRRVLETSRSRCASAGRWRGCDGDMLCAKRLTTVEIQARLAEVYGADVSRETISKVTDAVLEEMSSWLCRPLDLVYSVVFIDAIHVKVRGGQAANRAFQTAIGVTADGKRDILGIWASPGREGFAGCPHRALQPWRRGYVHRGSASPVTKPPSNRRASSSTHCDIAQWPSVMPAAMTARVTVSRPSLPPSA